MPKAVNHWNATQPSVALISEVVAWRTALASALEARGIRVRVLPESDGLIPLPIDPAPVALLIDDRLEPGGTRQVGAVLRACMVDCPPLVWLGGPNEDFDQDIYLARVDRYDIPEPMLTELMPILLRLIDAGSGVITRSSVDALVEAQLARTGDSGG